MQHIVTARLRLRPLEETDAAALYFLHREPSSQAGLPDEVYGSAAEAADAVGFLRSRYPRPGETFQLPLVLGIVRREDGALIGHVGLCGIPEGLEVEYAVGEAFQGKGYASEALAALLDWAEKALPPQNRSIYYGLAHFDNLASRRVLEKAGFAFVREELRDSFGLPVRWAVYQLNK